MKAEEKLERRDIRAKLTPVPSSIRADCGIGIISDLGALKDITELLHREGIMDFKAYMKKSGKWTDAAKGGKK